MTKDIAILILTIATFVSFNVDAKNDAQKPLTSEISQKGKSDSISDLTKKLIGQWGIYVTVSYTTFTNSIRETKQMCNSCPTIKFMDNQIAIMTYPSGDKENLTWSVKGKMLTMVSNDKSKKERFFSDPTYYMIFTQEKGMIELVLKQKNYSYILRR